MDEIFLSLLGLLCVLVVVAGVVVVPVVALVRTLQIGPLTQRVAELEEEVHRLRAAALPRIESSTEPPPVVRPRPASPPRRESPPPPARPRQPAVNVEALIGGRVLGWAAVVLLTFAVGFFLAYLFEHDLIGPLGRVGIVLVLGLALCGAGLRFHLRGWKVFSQFLTAGGVILLYLATYASFGYYNLLPREPAAAFLFALIVEAAALAVLYEAPGIAIMAVVGGLLAPVLLHSDRDQYLSLFLYLLVLNAGFAGLTLFRRWPAVNSVALAGTQVLFWVWYAENYHPEKRVAAAVFQGVLFALYLAHDLKAHLWRRWPANPEDLGRLVVNALLFSVAVFVLAWPEYTEWRGTAAVILATVYTGAALLVRRAGPSDERRLFACVAVAMAFIATAFAWQAEAAWIALGWAVEGVVLWWFGLRVQAGPLRWLGAIFLGLATWHLLIIDTPAAHAAPFIPVINRYGVPAMLVAAALVAAALASRRYLRPGENAATVHMRILGLAGVTVLWIVLSVEAYDYFQAQSNELARTWRTPAWSAEDDSGDSYAALQDRQQQLRRAGQAALSILWAAYAAAVLAVGFRLRSRPLRWFALGLFGLTLAKVGLIDTAALRGLYRVAAFFALSLMMGLGAWGYQKLRQALLPDDERETRHESA